MVVADTDAERHQGLREVTDLGAYDGMLFVFPEDITSTFTMADTLIPLDIDWYTVDGIYVSSEEMTPCPEGSDDECPPYGATGPYRYALETAAGRRRRRSAGTARRSLGEIAARYRVAQPGRRPSERNVSGSV